MTRSLAAGRARRRAPLQRSRALQAAKPAHMARRRPGARGPYAPSAQTTDTAASNLGTTGLAEASSALSDNYLDNASTWLRCERMSVSSTTPMATSRGQVGGSNDARAELERSLPPWFPNCETHCETFLKIRDLSILNKTRCIIGVWTAGGSSFKVSVGCAGFALVYNKLR